MREAREIAHPFSHSTLVYLWRLKAWCGCRVGTREYIQAFPSQSLAPQLSLSVITSTFRKLGRLRPHIPSTDSWPCIWMDF